MQICDEDMQDLQLACLFHDTGFVEQYEKNEKIWADIARKWLEKESIWESRIQKIENIILATILFSEPKTLLEKIIQDSDLDNLGTAQEFEYSQKYLEELRIIGKSDISERAYWEFVYNLLWHYRFHTDKAQSERSIQQQKNIEHMKKYLMMINQE
jgi:predicted metal-dependent HD superfamily phosphohydrolase